MNLPLAKLNRDELYTFIVGLFSALPWYQYYQAIGVLAKNTDVVDLTLVFAWLSMTGLVYILHVILIWILHLICERIIENQNDDDELRKMKMKKNLSFFWSGPLEEQKVILHICGLITVSLILVYHPVIILTSHKLGFSWLAAIRVTYSAVTIVAFLMLSKTIHYLLQVQNFLDKNYCDTLDQTTYLRERATFYAKIKNDEFFAHYQQYLKERNVASEAAKPAPGVDTKGRPKGE